MVRIFLLFLFVSTTFFYNASAQQKSTSQAVELSSILSNLENEYPYRFSYADETIHNIRITTPPSGLSFKEILNFLSQHTNLVFTILEGNFVSIARIQNKGNSYCLILLEFETKNLLKNTPILVNNNLKRTNDRGEVILSVTKNKVLIIEVLGYQTLVLKVEEIKNVSCQEIVLKPIIEELSELYLTDYITEGISKNKNGSFKIDYTEFDLLPGLLEADVLKTIQALPGIKSVDETVSTINIRGGTNDQNLLLWDGIKMYQSGHFFGLISIFNPNMTEKVTLFKNGTPGEYTDGVSGTILMQSSPDISDKLKAEFSLNFINVDGFVDVPVGKKSSVQVSARKAINPLIKTPTYNKYVQRVSQNSEATDSQEVKTSDVGFDFYDVNLRWNLLLTDKDKLRFNFLNIENSLIFTENALADQGLISRQSTLRQASLAGGINYHRVWNNKFQSTVQLYETRYNLQSNNANIIENQTFIQENKVSETGIKIQSVYNVNKQTNVQGGYQFTETGITNINDSDDPRFRENTVRVANVHSLFSQIHHHQQNWQTTFNAGLRFGYNTKLQKGLIEPRFVIHKKLFRYFNLEIAGELKHQFTSQIINFQNDFLGIEKRRWVLSDEIEIPIIRGRQISCGINYQRKGWLLSVDTYLKKVKGITARSQGFQNKYEFQKATGSYDIRGIEFMMNKKIQNISGWMGYTFSDNKYLFEKFEDRIFRNTIDITHALSLGATYSLDNLKVSAGFNWHSGLPYTLLEDDNVINGQINYAEANAVDLNNYFRIDASATYDFLLFNKTQASAGVAFWNLNNVKNDIATFYRLGEEQNVQQFYVNALRFTPNISFTVKF